MRSQPLIERRENQQKYYTEREKYLQEQLKFNPEWSPGYEKVKSVVEWVPAEKIKYYPDSMGTRTNGCVTEEKKNSKECPIMRYGQKHPKILI